MLDLRHPLLSFLGNLANSMETVNNLNNLNSAVSSNFNDHDDNSSVHCSTSDEVVQIQQSTPSPAGSSKTAHLHMESPPHQQQQQQHQQQPVMMIPAFHPALQLHHSLRHFHGLVSSAPEAQTPSTAAAAAAAAVAAAAAATATTPSSNPHGIENILNRPLPERRMAVPPPLAPPQNPAAAGFSGSSLNFNTGVYWPALPGFIGNPALHAWRERLNQGTMMNRYGPMAMRPTSMSMSLTASGLLLLKCSKLNARCWNVGLGVRRSAQSQLRPG